MLLVGEVGLEPEEDELALLMLNSRYVQLSCEDATQPAQAIAWASGLWLANHWETQE